jgi:hypothetical protein
VIIQGFEAGWLWRILLTLAGIILYLACVAFLLAELSPMIDTARENWLKVVFLVTFIPYLSGSVASTIGAFLNPISPVLILTSAAAAFGGASALAWMTQMYKTSAGSRLVTSRSEREPLHVISRSWGWIFVATVTLIVHIAVLGPSIQLR